LMPAILATGCVSAPSIVDARVSRTTLFDNQSAVLSVTVNDKDGLEDIVGAHLFTGDQGFWFGSLYEVSDGVFETVVDWPTLNEQQPIYFDFPVVRELLVVVEDNHGEVDEVRFTLTLSCRAGDHACDGVCYPIDLACEDV
ncbi:MAG: hypothetical protein KC420_17650, partial [Myxococcales bacterium]|nr:hypothetical protein [Myxococcales bacterium]